MVVKKEDLLTDLHTMHLNEIWKLRQKKTWQTHLCYTWQYIAGYNYIIISFQDSKLIYYGIESKIMFKFGEKDLNIFLLFFCIAFGIYSQWFSSFKSYLSKPSFYECWRFTRSTSWYIRGGVEGLVHSLDSHWGFES